MLRKERCVNRDEVLRRNEGLAVALARVYPTECANEGSAVVTEHRVLTVEACTTCNIPEDGGVSGIKDYLACRELTVRDASLGVGLLSDFEEGNLVAVLVVSIVLNNCL